MSYNAPKKLYISNKTDNKAITLKFDSAFTPNENTMQFIFKDSLNEKRIESGHIIINFGAGKWNKSDRENIKNALQNIHITKDGSTQIFELPKNIKIGY